MEAVGDGVTGFQPGDAVVGWCAGAFAEHAVVAEHALASKPGSLTFEEASAIGVSAMTALQGLRDHGKLQAGQHLLVVGASGGVGSFAVQIAKALGAEVTGVCSTRNLDLVRSIGADHVIDYTHADFTQGGPRYDLIFDNVGSHGLRPPDERSSPAARCSPTALPSAAGSADWATSSGRACPSVVVRQQGRPFVSMPRAR